MFAFTVIQFVLRCIMRLLGPEMYPNFAKYMRQQLLLINQDFMLRRYGYCVERENIGKDGLR